MVSSVFQIQTWLFNLNQWGELWTKSWSSSCWSVCKFKWREKTCESVDLLCCSIRLCTLLLCPEAHSDRKPSYTAQKLCCLCFSWKRFEKSIKYYIIQKDNRFRRSLYWLVSLMCCADQVHYMNESIGTQLLIFEFRCFIQSHYHRYVKSSTYPCNMPLQTFVKEGVVLKSSLNLSMVL